MALHFIGSHNTNTAAVQLTHGWRGDKRREMGQIKTQEVKVQHCSFRPTQPQEKSPAVQTNALLVASKKSQKACADTSI